MANIRETKITSDDVAEFFLAYANECGEQITNLKLQKLVYYAQAWYLANFHKPLFEEDFQAWVHGPVIPDLYRKYKERGCSPIITELELNAVKEKFESTTLDFLTEVASIYMTSGAYELELMTHNEEPWLNARKGFEPDQKCESVISKKSMEIYYGQTLQYQKT
ncbi:MAG: hypothetical protein UT32_C0023G0004 [Parcubacteria group bacterium GW2011_GWC2_39_14]|nr:MAG: hypothetical protein UT32_C0023G0004 [Parcubacteria group bacterium GW2011_GWC2_39_14]KKR53575.1 MAG: hypothetical protein UT91_C0025G0004 [Parcubacteria group bacterium GW2011_GWA2_40_23]